MTFSLACEEGVCTVDQSVAVFAFGRPCLHMCSEMWVDQGMGQVAAMRHMEWSSPEDSGRGLGSWLQGNKPRTLGAGEGEGLRRVEGK